MGVQFNILDNPALRMRLAPVEMAQGGATPNANRPAPPTPAPAPGGQPGRAPVNTAAAFPLDGGMDMLQGPLTGNLLDEATLILDNAPPSVVEANAEANRAQDLDGAPAPRFPDFRFFVTAGSAQERNLETRLDLLEQRLEATGNRLRFADSLSIRIDAQLDRARLERELETVSREIRRLRLEQVFARPSPTPEAVDEAPPPEQPAEPTGGIPPTMQEGPQPARNAGLNLLA